MIDYKRVAKINTGTEYTENYDDTIREFAEIFDFEILELKEKNQKILEDCYGKMKAETQNK